MSERLIIRVTLRDVPEHATAGGNRGPRLKPARPGMGGRMGPWMLGGAVAAGLLVVLAATVLMDFSDEPPVQSAVAASEARTTDSGSVETGSSPSTEAAVLQVKPAARPAPERKDVPAEATAEPEMIAAVRPAADDTDGDGDAKLETIAESIAEMPERPAVAAMKPVEKPKTAMPKEQVASGPPERATVRPTKPKTVATAPTARSGQRPALDKPDPAGAPAISDPRVLRAQLSAGVKGKEPTARLQPPIRVTNGSDRTIYYFSEVRNLDGQTLFHRWEREGRVLASVPFEIRGQRWRVYSRKTITPRMTGTWRVVLADAGGKELASSTFSVR